MLNENPTLANQGLACDERNTIPAHPLHRICDAVFSGIYSQDEGVEIAKVFLQHGADVNGNELLENRDTPLIAAASLHAEKLGLLYIQFGANIHHRGTHGGTALHWAAWTGQDLLVKRLIAEKAAVNKRCIDFESTPLLWTVHGYKTSGKDNRFRRIQCAVRLIEAGADKTIPNKEGQQPIQFLDETDVELLQLLK